MGNFWVRLSTGEKTAGIAVAVAILCVGGCFVMRGCSGIGSLPPGAEPAAPGSMPPGNDNPAVKPAGDLPPDFTPDTSDRRDDDGPLFDSTAFEKVEASPVLYNASGRVSFGPDGMEWQNAIEPPRGSDRWNVGDWERWIVREYGEPRDVKYVFAPSSQGLNAVGEALWHASNARRYRGHIDREAVEAIGSPPRNVQMRPGLWLLLNPKDSPNGWYDAAAVVAYLQARGVPFEFRTTRIDGAAGLGKAPGSQEF